VKKHRLNACIWTADDDGNWGTECNNMFAFDDGDPDDNNFVFCPYCGKVLAMTPRGGL
jgi:hypothetical protein